MQDSLLPLSLPAGTFTREHQGASLKHIQALRDFADRDLQDLIIPHGIMPIFWFLVNVSKLLLLLGWYDGSSNLFAFNLQKTNLQWFSICPNYTRHMYYTTGVL